MTFDLKFLSSNAIADLSSNIKEYFEENSLDKIDDDGLRDMYGYMCELAHLTGFLPCSFTFYRNEIMKATNVIDREIRKRSIVKQRDAILKG